jgi:hypothetical protein
VCTINRNRQIYKVSNEKAENIKSYTIQINTKLPENLRARDQLDYYDYDYELACDV